MDGYVQYCNFIAEGLTKMYFFDCEVALIESFCTEMGRFCSNDEVFVWAKVGLAWSLLLGTRSVGHVCLRILI